MEMLAKKSCCALCCKLVNEDRRAFGRGPSMEYGPPGGGMEPQRERFNTLQGATGVRQNSERWLEL